MSTLRSTLGKKLNLTAQEWITVEYKGELFKIYEHECREIQVLVSKGELSPEDLIVYDTEGKKVRFREDGKFYDDLKQYHLCTNLAFEIL